MTNEKELKRKLRALRKLKKDTQQQTQARRDINKQIRGIKAELEVFKEARKPDDEKQALINEILAIYKRTNRPNYVDLNVYDKYQLQVHLNKLKEPKRGF